MIRNYKEYYNVVNKKKVYWTKDEIISHLEKQVETFEHNRPFTVKTIGNETWIYNVSGEKVWYEQQ